jgi:hypothetical protein
MRLGNFTILAGNAGAETDPELVSTGSSSAADIALDRKTNEQYTFSANHGSEDNEFPYGNVNLYNVSRISTSTELSVTQSLGTPLAGTVKTSFISIANGEFGG